MTELPMCLPEVGFTLLLIGFIELVVVLAIALHRKL